MSNTIELLDSIGRDATLRHASTPELERALDRMHASPGLRMAAASGRREPLFKELGSQANVAVQVNQNPHNGGNRPDEQEDSQTPAGPGRDTDSGDVKPDS